MLANSDTVVLGVGDSYMQGSEAGDATASFLNNYCALKGYDCMVTCTTYCFTTVKGNSLFYFYIMTYYVFLVSLQQ